MSVPNFSFQACLEVAEKSGGVGGGVVWWYMWLLHCKKYNFGHEIRFLSMWDFSQIFRRFFSMSFSSNFYEIFLRL